MCAGPLTLPDIQGLFQPIPFGDPAPPSAFQLAAGRYAPLWDAFRVIDMDKQSRVLQVSLHAVCMSYFVEMVLQVVNSHTVAAMRPAGTPSG